MFMVLTPLQGKLSACWSTILPSLVVIGVIKGDLKSTCFSRDPEVVTASTAG